MLDWGLMHLALSISREIGSARNRAGGIYYHVRAWISRGRRWAPFRKDLANWLEAWNPSETELLIIGPSAGYCLPQGWLNRFQKVTAVDPDPLAKALFRVLHPGLPLQWRQEEVLVPGEGFAQNLREAFQMELKKWQSHLDRSSGAAVLFSNFLGQLGVLVPAEMRESWLVELKQNLYPTLKGRTWASFHDVLSGPVPPQIKKLDKDFSGQAQTSPHNPGQTLIQVRVEQLAQKFYSKEVILEDHLIGDLFPPTLNRDYFSWELKRGQYHLVEAIYERK